MISFEVPNKLISNTPKEPRIRPGFRVFFQTMWETDMQIGVIAYMNEYGITMFPVAEGQVPHASTVIVENVIEFYPWSKIKFIHADPEFITEWEMKTDE